jgi:hypothetical protein
MSFCRWSEGDLYIYEDYRGFFNCMNCHLNEVASDGFRDDHNCKTLQELREHVQAHEEAGHEAPYESIYARIQRDRE